jgi:hypothetical protein
MKCALCNQREANKKNTHYLTDGIIRSCLNQDGSNEREKGLHFDISNDKPSVEVSFQRSTSPEKIEKTLGREPTEEEIAAAKKNDFAVDNVFCTECESRFGVVEAKFIDTLLPQLRNDELVGQNEINFKEAKLMRLFFYMQVWRTAVCDTTFKLSQKTLEQLRLSILKGLETPDEEFDLFPISITYLITLGGEDKYTYNWVGITDDRNPNIILMNDFLVQFFESEESIRFLDFYGINNADDFKHYINVSEGEFRIKVISDDERKKFLEQMGRTSTVPPKLKNMMHSFIQTWIQEIGTSPSGFIIADFVKGFIEKTKDTDGVNQLSEEQMNAYRSEFIRNKKKPV